MLEIIIPSTELYDNSKNEFIYIQEQKIELEHSLVSLSKWESKWHIPFFKKKEKTIEEIVDYIRCMTLTPEVPYEIYNFITPEIINEVTKYIDDSMTATTFHDNKKDRTKKRNDKTITSEVIYYYMTLYNIPIECQDWHLNRLLTLIQVCSVNNNPKKMSKKDILAQNRSINAARRKKH